jgi:hypothetical protein
MFGGYYLLTFLIMVKRRRHVNADAINGSRARPLPILMLFYLCKATFSTSRGRRLAGMTKNSSESLGFSEQE